MGERVVMQEALFYEFSLDRHVRQVTLVNRAHTAHSASRDVTRLSIFSKKCLSTGEGLSAR